MHCKLLQTSVKKARLPIHATRAASFHHSRPTLHTTGKPKPEDLGLSQDQPRSAQSTSRSTATGAPLLGSAGSLPHFRHTVVLLQAELHSFGTRQAGQTVQSKRLLTEFAQSVWHLLGLPPLDVRVVPGKASQPLRLEGAQLMATEDAWEPREPQDFALCMQSIVECGLAQAITASAGGGTSVAGNGQGQLEQLLELVYGRANPPAGNVEKQAARLLCQQDSVVIGMVGGETPCLRLFPAEDERTVPCVEVPGIGAGSGTWPNRLSAMLCLFDIKESGDLPPTLVPGFWQCLPRAMTDEGRWLFTSFNAGLPEPASVGECYLRLSRFHEWVHKLAARQDEL